MSFYCHRWGPVALAIPESHGVQRQPGILKLQSPTSLITDHMTKPNVLLSTELDQNWTNTENNFLILLIEIQSMGSFPFWRVCVCVHMYTQVKIEIIYGPYFNYFLHMVSEMVLMPVFLHFVPLNTLLSLILWSYFVLYHNLDYFLF